MLTVCSGPSALLGGNACGELSGRKVAELIMSSRLLQADYVLSSSLELEVSKSLSTDKLINTEPSRPGWWKVRGKPEKDRKGGRKVVGKSRAQPYNFFKVPACRVEQLLSVFGGR